ncbi:MAG TPA: DUF3617 family protein [Dissulfurispiraceae bacterium]|nr:DUF3617 family protein [Dissulfurispiraceae bacterium]
MTRSAGLFAVIVLAVFSLMVVGCGDKAKEGGQAPAPAKPKVNMQEGQWEITTTMEMPGMPANMMKPHTVTTCLTQKEPVAKFNEKSDCKMQDLTTVGNTVSWKIVCPEATSKGSITYAGTTYDGAVETDMKMEGKQVTSKMTLKGKYLGPCPEPAAPAQK